MPKYLFEASYSVEGTQGVLREGGTSRRATVEQMVKGLGGTMEAFYFAYGDTDVFVIVDLPDDASASAAALTVKSMGSGNVKTTVLLTPETIDEAAKKSVGYRPPGK